MVDEFELYSFYNSAMSECVRQLWISRARHCAAVGVILRGWLTSLVYVGNAGGLPASRSRHTLKASFSDHKGETGNSLSTAATLRK